MRQLFVLLVCCFLGIGMTGASRIDSVLYCAVDQELIDVSLQGDVPCVHYLDRLSVVQRDMEDSIERVSSYASGKKNVFYRRGLLADLVMKKEQTATMQNRIVLAMNNYKQRLYSFIRPRVIAIMTDDQERCVQYWQSMTSSGGCWYGQDVLIERIVATDELDGLLQLLIEYNSLRDNYGYG